MKKKVPIFSELRNNALSFDAQKSGISPIGKNEVFGVVMDMSFPEGWATIVVFADGNASLYLSGGGGVIGGGGHESARKAAVKMVETADKCLNLTQSTKETPLPEDGYVLFYILTTKGIMKATAKEEDLGEQRNALSPLFYTGQDVIMQLRLISNDFK